jgi:ribA/ribD-fused uncharacterized protein
MIIYFRSGSNYGFLSNFFESNFEFDGRNWLSSEAAYQAMKTLDLNEQEEIRFLKPKNAKEAGQKVTLRKDWDRVKLRFMEDIVRAKFTNPVLRESLKATGEEELVEETWWHDLFWGICICREHNRNGLNHLGKILMKVRSEL